MRYIVELEAQGEVHYYPMPIETMIARDKPLCGLDDKGKLMVMGTKFPHCQTCWISSDKYNKSAGKIDRDWGKDA